MRILHVISSMTQHSGGPPVVCAGLTKAQASLGHEVTVVWAGIGEPNVPLDSSVQGMEFPREGSVRYQRSKAMAAWLESHVGRMDMVHVHSIWQFPSYAATRACRRHGTPYVVLLNGMLNAYHVTHSSYWIKRIYWHLRERHALRRAQGLHFLSQTEIDQSLSWVRDMPKFIAGNGVAEADLDRLPARGAFRSSWPAIGERPMVLYMARLHPVKGLERFLGQWRRVVASQPRAVLAIAGGGEPGYEASIDALIRDQGLTDSVVRVGRLSGARKWEALADADVFVLPSYQEGFSMAVVEALGAGCPVVITRECNFPEVATSGAGRVIGGGDMGAFADAVGELLGNAAVRRQTGAAGAALVRQRYTWERIAADTIRVYEWIRAGRSLPSDGADVWRPGGGNAVSAIPATPSITSAAI